MLKEFNSVFERGKKMNKIRLIVLALVFLIMGGGLTISGVTDIIKMGGDIPDFNYDSIANIKKGDFAAGYIANIYDCYAGETTTNTTMGIETSSYTSREYFIMPLVNDTDLENNMFISVSVSDKEDRDTLYAICDATYEYLDGNEDADFPDMAFIGRAAVLDDELMGYMADWFEEAEYFDGGRSEAMAHIIPYDLMLYNPNSAYISLVVGLIMIAVVIVAAIIIFHVSKGKTKQDDTAEQEFTGYTQVNAEPAPVPETADAAPESNGFAENAYSQPLPDIPQPIDPDEFFAKPKKPEPVKEEEPAAPAEEQSNEIETSGMDAEKVLREQEEAAALNQGSVVTGEGIETGELNAEQVLYEQEQALEASRKPVETSEGIETGELDAEQVLYEQEQALEASRKPVETSEGIETGELNAEQVLYEQEQALAAAQGPAVTGEEIDTSDLEMGGLEYFEAPAEDNDDIFEFSNDLDYDVNASEIKISE